MSKRKWILTKVEAGDYLLPSNDNGKVLWRISEETRHRWTLHHMLGADYDVARPETALRDWNRWDCYGSGYATRQEAIQSAMDADARRIGEGP